MDAFSNEHQGETSSANHKANGSASDATAQPRKGWNAGGRGSRGGGADDGKGGSGILRVSRKSAQKIGTLLDSRSLRSLRQSIVLITEACVSHLSFLIDIRSLSLKSTPDFIADKLSSNEDAMRQRRHPTLQAMRSFRRRMCCRNKAEVVRKDKVRK